MKPTYKLDELLKVIPNSSGTTTTIGNGGLKLTIDVILKTVIDNAFLMQEFAEKIAGDDLEQTVYNIWHFIKTNIEYVKDKPLTEEIRTPQRLLNDKKGDCDDFSIFAASILKSLNYEPFFYIVAFNNLENYGHIYVGVDNYILDGVMSEYGEHPRNITKTMILKLNGSNKVFNRSLKNQKNTKMLIQQLAGMPEQDINDFVESEFERLSNMEGLTEQEHEDLNKVKTLKLLSGNDYQKFMLELMPDIAGIDEDMNISFHNDEDLIEAENFLEEFKSLQGLGDTEGIGSLFSRWRKNRAKRRARRKKFWKKLKEKVKKISKKITKVVKKVSFAAPRGAILLLLRLNLFKWGSRLWISYLPKEKAKQYGFNMKTFEKVVNFRKKFEKFFVKAGGKKKAIFNAVSKRGAKIARKKWGIQGLGVEPTTTAAGASIAAASPFLAFLGKIWRPIKKLFKNMFKKGAGKKVLKAVVNKFNDAKKETVEDSKYVVADNSYTSKSNDTSNPVNNNANNGAGKKSSNLLVPIGIAATLLAFVVLNK